MTATLSFFIQKFKKYFLEKKTFHGQMENLNINQINSLSKFTMFRKWSKMLR